MLREFRDFAFRGNIIDLAVGVVIGVAFNAIVGSLAEDVLMNLVAAVVGKPDFSDLVLTIGNGVVRYGAFLTAVVNFVLIAFALFLFVKAVNRMMKAKAREGEAAPAVRECPYCLTKIPSQASKCSACASGVPAAA